MPIVNTECLQLACRKLKIPYACHDTNENFVCVHLEKPYFFVNCSTPFNNDGVSKICKDKEFSYRLLNKATRMPKTRAFFDPHHGNEDYKRHIEQRSCAEITQDILRDFKLPVIIKMNAGARGINVFLCRTPNQILEALEEIYRKDSSSYDYIALAQEHIQIKKEYRVIVFEKEVLLVYEKDFSQATFVDNLSPLHQENSKAVLVTDQKFIARIAKFIQPMFGVLDLQFAGLDIVIDEKGDFILLELNNRPGFTYFVRDNGKIHLIKMYEKILKKLSASSLIEKALGTTEGLK